MKIIDRVSKGLGLSDGEESDQDMDTQDDKPAEKTEMQEPPIQPPPANPAGHNVIDFNSATRDNFMINNNTTTDKPMIAKEVKAVYPKSFDDVKIIADFLREDYPVVVSLEETTPENGRRIIDFALGTTYAIDGDVQQINELVFLCTPKSVLVTFYKEEPKQEHHDFSWLTRKI